jgi:hypothetical protein
MDVTPLILVNNVPYSRYCNSEQESLPKTQQVTDGTKNSELNLRVEKSNGG